MVIEFMDYVLIWRDYIILNRRRNKERPIDRWVEMKVLIRRHFVPSRYYRDLYLKLQGLTQDSWIINECHKEIKITIIHNNIIEGRKATMTRFFN